MMTIATLQKPRSTKALLERAALVKAEIARRETVAFTLYTKRDYEVNWHHKVVGAKLDAVLEGKIKRLIILEPPQNGKSEQVSRRFPALALGRNPNRRIIACSYNDSLAQDMSRDVQKIMASKEYATLFPNARLAEARDEQKRTQGHFEVVGGTGYYIGVGIMGSMTGKTSDIGIVDDPFKNRAEAESEIFRDRVWDQYQSSFAQRQFGSDGAIIICQTRWHEDDLVGRLLNQAKNVPNADQWEVVCLPAIAEQREKYREVGDPLWPAKYPMSTLNARRAGLGEYDWAALFQQRPSPSGGGLFKEEWFKNRFLDVEPSLMRKARGWDTAGTELGGDYTCGVKIGEEFLQDDATGDVNSTGRFVVLDVVHKQLGPAGVAALMSVTAELDGACAQREEKEGGSAGLAVIQTRTKEMAGKDYAGVQISGSKVTRSKPFRQQCEAGNVWLLRAPWNEEYIKELCGFPTAAHDDQVDGSSCAFNAVLLEEPPETTRLTWG